MSSPNRWKDGFLRKGAILLAAGIAATCQLDPGKKPDTFSFPNLADSLSRYDSTYIILLDDKGNPIDTLYRSRVHTASDLVKLEAPRYQGGKTRILIIGFEGKKEAYHVERAYDPVHQRVDSISVLVSPGTSIRLANRAVEIPIKTLVPFPEVAVEPKQLIDKRYVWTADPRNFIRVEEGGLRGLAVGVSQVIVNLISDPGRKDTLTVTVTPRPALPDSIRIRPDSLVLAAGGRALGFSVEAFPFSASKQVDWKVSHPDLATIGPDGLARGLAKGMVTVRAVSREDSGIVDSARIQILDPVHVESVRFLEDSIEVFAGGTPGKLEVEVNPVLASPALRYQVADSTVVMVQNDQVLGLKEGSTSVIGISQDSPAIRDTLRAIVLSRQKVDSVIAITDTVRLYLHGPSFQLSAKVFPPAAAQRVDWKSPDENLVRVDATGKATPIAAGRTSIIALARADSSKQDRIVALIRKDTPLLALGRADTTVPKGGTVLFRPKAPQEHGEITHFEWDFDGDGTWDGYSDTLKEVSHLYAATGDFSARFRVQDTEGNDTLVVKRIHVVVGPVILILQPPDQFKINQKTIDVIWSVDEVEQTVQKKEVLLQYGPNTVTRTANDSAGNVYSASVTVYLDTLPPARPKLAGLTPVNTKTPTWSWSSGGNGGNGTYRYWLDNEEVSNARSIKDTAFTPATDLSPGTHTLFLQERDEAGNWSAISRSSIVIDLTSPAPPVPASGFISLTNNPKPTWVWSSGNSDGMGVFRYRLDNNDLSQGMPTLSGFSLTADGNLAEGPHTLHIQERDSAGNWSATASLMIRIDLTPPASPSLDSTPYSPLNTLRPTWTWKGGGGGMGVFRCKIDDPDLSSGADTVSQTICKAGKDYAEGIHSLYVQERDSAGNWSATSHRELMSSLRNIVGSSGFSNREIDPYSAGMKISALYGPIVIYNEADGATAVAKRMQSGVWANMGDPSVYGSFIWNKSFALSPSGIPYIVVQDSNNRATVLRFAQNRWEIVGNADFADGGIGEAALSFNESGIPYIAYRDEFVEKTSVRKLVGSTWELVGPRGFSRGFTIFHNLVITKSGTLYLACIGDSLESNSISIRKFNSNTNSWNALASFPVHSYASYPFQLAAGQGDSIYIALFARETMAIEVYKETNNSWVRVGGSVSGTQVENDVGFAISNSGHLYVSYRDESKANRLTVKTYRSNSWIAVGPEGFSSEAGRERLSILELDQNDVPYILYSDVANGKRATVMKIGFDP